jgi:hypothetical protein
MNEENLHISVGLKKTINIDVTDVIFVTKNMSVDDRMMIWDSLLSDFTETDVKQYKMRYGARPDFMGAIKKLEIKTKQLLNVAFNHKF